MLWGPICFGIQMSSVLTSPSPDIFPSSEENPCDIDEKATAMDEREDGQKDEDEVDEEKGAEEMEQEQTDQPGEENVQEPKTEDNDGEGGENAEADEESSVKDEEEEEKAERGQEAGKDEDLAIPNDKGEQPKVCRPTNYYTFFQHRSCLHTKFYCVTIWTCNAYRRRTKELVKMRSSQSLLRGRSTTQTVRLESRMFRVIQLWSWQGRRQRETKLKRYSTHQLNPVLLYEEESTFYTKSSYYHLLLMNLFTCGTIPTVVSNVHSLLLLLIKSVWNMQPPSNSE